MKFLMSEISLGILAVLEYVSMCAESVVVLVQRCRRFCIRCSECVASRIVDVLPSCTLLATCGSFICSSTCYSGSSEKESQHFIVDMALAMRSSRSREFVA